MTTQRHREFQQRLVLSAPAVFAVGLLHHYRGESVVIPGLQIAPTADEHRNYVDGGDLFVVSEMKRRRIEVKRLSCNFTGPDDWPYGAEMFIGPVAQTDRLDARGAAEAYYSVSNDYAAVGLIKPASKPKWYRKHVPNRLTGNVVEVYACPLGEVTFERLAPHITQMIITIAPRDAADAERILAQVGKLLGAA